MSPPENLIDLVHLENVFDCLDTYLWLGYRFTDMFPHMELVRDMQRELDMIIQEGVFNITKLLERSESPTSSKIAEIDPDGNNFAGKVKTELHMKKAAFMGSDAGGRYKRGSLTQRLLDEGIVTQEMVAQLQDEWRTVSGRKGTTNSNDTTKSLKFSKKKRS